MMKFYYHPILGLQYYLETIKKNRQEKRKSKQNKDESSSLRNA